MTKTGMWTATAVKTREGHRTEERVDGVMVWNSGVMETESVGDGDVRETGEAGRGVVESLRREVEGMTREGERDGESERVMKESLAVHTQGRQARLFYSGVSARGWTAWVKEAKRSMKGMSSVRGEGERPESFLASLETRADVVLYRSGRVSSMAMAHHALTHGHVRRYSADGTRDRVRTARGVCLHPMDVLEIRPETWGRWSSTVTERDCPVYRSVDRSRGRVCLLRRPRDGEVYRPVGMSMSVASMGHTFKK